MAKRPWTSSVAVMRSPLAPHSASARELHERLEAARRGASFLVYRDADDRQILVELPEAGGPLSIGRRPGNDVPLSWDSEVSRLHAKIERTGADWVLCDDGLSRNGTFVNGARVSGRRRLRGGDVIVMGETAIAFCSPDGQPSASGTITGASPHEAIALSPAQRRVLTALCRPLAESRYAVPASNRQIADELCVSVDAVKTCLHGLFERFALVELPQNQKRAALAREALERGLVDRRTLRSDAHS
jgi:pSer/pThr/pTyr-binding forkhead associated (FHA) protein